MAAPTFVAASTGGTDASGAWTATCHAPGAADRVIILQVLVDGVTAGAPTISSTTNIKDLAGTSGVWTSIGTFNVGSPTAASQQLYIGRSASTSAPVVTGANTGGDDVYYRFYEFDNCSTGTTLATVIENVTGGATVNAVGTSSSAADASVTTVGPDRLAVNFVAANDDVTMGRLIGATGGYWVEAVAEYSDATGTDGAIGLQIAYPSAVNNLNVSGSLTNINGATGTSERIAQSFTTSGGSTYAVSIYGQKASAPTDNVVAAIQADTAGAPSGSDLVSVAVALTGVSISLGWTRFQFATGLALTNGTTYWLAGYRSGARDTTNVYRSILSAASTYANGTGAVEDSGAWTNQTGDFSFQIELDTGAVIDGGASALSLSADWGTCGFALIGTTVVAPPATLLPEIGFVNFSDPGVL